MINTAPYNSWPLHVKLFHPEAVKAWNTAETLVPNMPEGFTCSVELEGVDGKSGVEGSGRKGPIDVKDSGLMFILSYDQESIICCSSSDRDAAGEAPRVNAQRFSRMLCVPGICRSCQGCKFVPCIKLRDDGLIIL